MSLSSSFIFDHAFINGEWVHAADDRTFEVTNPATGERIGRVPLMGAKEAGLAITAAEAAWRDWAARPALERADILLRWHSLMLENADILAELLTSEQGKALSEAKGEIIYAAGFLRFFAEEGRRIYGETIPSARTDSRIIVLKQPIGVVGCITPWNFPAAMITRKVAPALAAGCAVVVKPAELTPLSALALARLAELAGLPAGLLNIITGNPQEIGQTLCDNRFVRKISFTGSTATGRIIATQSAATIKKMSLELGGNAPFIIFEDADFEQALHWALFTKFRHSGQTCVCTNRFLVHASLYEDFIGRFARKIAALKVGNGASLGTEIGPLINLSAIAKLQSHIDDAVGKGAKIIVGGKTHHLGGNFFQPTLLADVTPDMLTAQEEIFGPVASVMRFESEAEAISIANDTDYGLAGYFFTRDLARAWRVAERLECGMVGINSGILSLEMAPFGGIKQSGLGREGSRHGIEEFLQMKFVNIGGV